MDENIPLIPFVRADDLHNLEFSGSADLVLFMAGNQFMAMKEIVAAFQEERTEGTTIFTTVHHRETPLRISNSTVDVGPVWATEVIHARLSGLACEAVEPGEKLDQRDKIGYYVCKLKHAPHQENAQKFFDFIISSPCQRIYQKYGFLSYAL